MARKRKTREEKQEILSQGVYASIHDLDSLREFLIQNSNAYHTSCLGFLVREQSLSPEQKANYDEKHHIIPTSEGGPDEEWNLVHVTYEEHANLHRTRYEIYGLESDFLAFRGRENLPPDARAQKIASSKRGHETMKKNQIGWYNSEEQRQRGLKSGGKMTPSRELAYQKQAAEKNKYTPIFEQRLIWTYSDGRNQWSVTSEANAFQRSGQIRPFLIENFPANLPNREVFVNAVKDDKSFTSNINKVLRRLIPNPDNQDVRLQYKGWSVNYETGPLNSLNASN